MKTAIVANPAAAAGRVGHRWGQIESSLVQVFEAYESRLTRAQGDATKIVQALSHEGATRVVVVGGDGTFNEAICGLMAIEPSARPALCYYPMGTGGDFARSIGLGGNAPIELRREDTMRTVDVGRVRLGDGRVHYFINASSFGASAKVVDIVNRGSKRLGGRVTFCLGTLKGMMGYRNCRVRIRIDDHFEEDVLLNTLVVANGRYFGGAMCVAPDACVDDGLLDIIIMGDIGPSFFMRHGHRIYRGKHLNLPHVRHFRGSTLSAACVDDANEVLLETDGERPRTGALPAHYDVMRRAIQLWAPWHRAVAIDS